MTKQELKNNNIENLLDKSIEEFLNEKIEEYNIIEKIKRPMQVAKKLQTSMMLARPKMNHHNLDLSKVSSDYNFNNKKCSYGDIKPKEVEQSTLPAEIRTEVRKAGLNKIEWTDTKDLPMGMNTAISEMGKKVFKSFGLKEGSPINSISSLKNNDLLNSNLELNSVLSFLERNTEKVFKEPATQIFDTSGNPYEPKIQLYYTQKKAYLAVFEGKGQGMEGNYIYAFERDPELSLKNDLDKVENKKNKKKLK